MSLKFLSFQVVVLTLSLSLNTYAKSKSDKDILTEARQSFEKKDFKKALTSYSLIGPESDFWLDAIEERAWTWVRIGQFENALADIKSIESPVWNSQIGPETLLLSTYISLELCHYQEVQKKIEKFKNLFMVKVDHLEKITNSSLKVSTEILKEFPQLEKVNMFNLGSKAALYPRYFFKDKILIESQKNKHFILFSQRLKELALRDLKDIEIQLKRIKLIEVEWTQDLLASNQNQTQLKKSNFSKIDKKSQMQFPITDDEFWLDEVGQYQVKADRCSRRLAEVQ